VDGLAIEQRAWRKRFLGRYPRRSRQRPWAGARFLTSSAACLAPSAVSNWAATAGHREGRSVGP